MSSQQKVVIDLLTEDEKGNGYRIKIKSETIKESSIYYVVSILDTNGSEVRKINHHRKLMNEAETNSGCNVSVVTVNLYSNSALNRNIIIRNPNDEIVRCYQLILDSMPELQINVSGTVDMSF